jgi:hypothetical protein
MHDGTYSLCWPEPDKQILAFAVRFPPTHFTRKTALSSLAPYGHAEYTTMPDYTSSKTIIGLLNKCILYTYHADKKEKVSTVH